MWWPKALHCFSKEIQCRFAIPALGDITFKHLTFVIYSAPQVVRFAVDLHENLVQVPLPIRMRTNLLNPFPSDLGRKHRPKPVPPETDRLMTDIDAAFVQQIFDVPERKREPNIHHNRQADDVGRRLEVLEWVTFFHPATLSVPLAHFNQVSADSAPSCHCWSIEKSGRGFAPANAPTRAPVQVARINAAISVCSRRHLQPFQLAAPSELT